jgi:cysteine desulfurase / selenocysteine lyase
MATIQQELDAQEIRRQFPFFQPHPEMRSLIYLDNAATTQKPYAVLDALMNFYAHHNANVHRGEYGVGAKASELFEAARERVARFLNAREPAEIIFTRGTTESINLVAASWGGSQLREGDEVILSEMEHHANVLPWMQIARAKGARIVVWRITDEGRLDPDELRRLITERTRMVAVTHISNVLGTINPVADICRIAHEAGVLCLVDAAQSAAHLPHRCASLRLRLSGIFGAQGLRSHGDWGAVWQARLAGIDASLSNGRWHDSQGELGAGGVGGGAGAL